MFIKLILKKFALHDKHEIGKNYTLYFRKCNHNQMMYQELSAKVDKASYNAAMNMTMILYPKCNNITYLLDFTIKTIIEGPCVIILMMSNVA